MARMRHPRAPHRDEHLNRSVISDADFGAVRAHHEPMELTHWINASGERLDHTQMRELRGRAGALYAMNSHIFEDELDALTALGVVSLSSRSELAQAGQVAYDD
jgi:hypothetical protein